ncbi:Nitrogen regulatory protein P-II [Alloactinosynnema sp. L-07]|uniref:FAD/NAD(P)-binding protein n=1 Tax=Alloactinosynnema sp. L-07 TaxID=1653480 RepID=UPI00065EF7CA|nr:FAD/NAD(P)-binding protein [Alloactinosynnema sp. L-07]CRK62030.1 Nitrogen regulatory protein P-II [Alloactinosynnema sp. L-07]
MNEPGVDPLVVVIIGAGPRGTGILERLLANAGVAELPRPLRVELVDPYPPGGGRVWREEQSSLMWMNAMAGNVTMFTDETVRCGGPIRPGPSLSEWAAADGTHWDVLGMSFASRQVQSRYLSWVFDRIVADTPDGVTVTVHETTATRLDGGHGERQTVWLAGRDEPLVADAVVLALGHQEAEPTEEDLRVAGFAARHGLRHLSSAYTADADLSGFKPGENVVLRGFGAAFVDVMALLTQGRGGEYVVEEGRLRYVPCGQEPVLWVGSRRGVPQRAKIAYRLCGQPAPLPRFFEAAALDEVLAGRERVDFHSDLWPLMAKEIGWGYYHELFTAHPHRVMSDWPEFAAAYAACAFDSAELRELVEAAVPEPADRFDLPALDRPLDGLWFTSLADVQLHVRKHVAADLRRRDEFIHSADLGAYYAMLSVNRQLRQLRAADKLSARSMVEDVHGWWQGFFEYYTSGPPAQRSRQLLALSEAGVLRFLGANMWVATDDDLGVFVAGSASTADSVEATALVEARLPRADLSRTTDPLLRALYDRGEATDHVLSDEDGFEHSSGLLLVSTTDFKVLDRDGNPHPRRYAIGPFTNVRHFATFATPRSNAVSFRQNDALARGALRVIGAGLPGSENPSSVKGSDT